MAEEKIELRTCANEALSLSAIGVGCWSFGSKDGEYWGERDQEDINKLCAAALENGAVFFDTAELYQDGRSEEALRVALESCDESLSKQAMIGTKIAPGHCDTVRERLDASLARLGVDSVELYQVHWPLNELSNAGHVNVAKAFGELAELQKEGKIKNIGVSNFGVKQLEEALATGVKIATNQIMYNCVTRGVENEVIPFCTKHSIGIIAYSPVMQGLLTDKWCQTDFDKMDPLRVRTRHFDGQRKHSRHQSDGAEKELREALNGLVAISKKEQRSVESLALAWLLANPAVVSVIPGARDVSQLSANLDAARRPLSAEAKSEIDRITDPVKEKLGSFMDMYQSEKDQRSL